MPNNTIVLNNSNNSKMGLQSSQQTSALSLALPHQHLCNPTLVTVNDRPFLRITCSVDELEYERWDS
jgi:hypothetical protein